MNFLDQIWLIPLFPLIGAAIQLVIGPRLDPQGEHHLHHPPARRALVGWISCAAVGLAFVWSVGAVWQLAHGTSRIHEVVKYTWVAGLPFQTMNGGLSVFRADWGFLLDPLSSVMILFVSGIAFLIHVYAVGYMQHDGGYYRFFGYLNLFVFFMLTLVLANNYVLLFAGWEGVGLCSYLLIGFYFHKKSAGDAANKAFLVNRVGDAGFLLGVMTMFLALGSVRFLDVDARLATGGAVSLGVLNAMALLLFLGACGKSAQFPLHVWLPDAMEGPTPVSALIHAATMVTAGVYMVARSHALFSLALDASQVVAVVGCFTAILAASIALVQNDIKKVLAYSTVSQLGYMFLALGVGAYWVAIFHVFTHAFFKALLFLGAGSVIHAVGGEQDMQRMGGLRSKLPVTHNTMLVATLAITGIPGFAGFFSKDEILAQVYGAAHGSKLLYAVGLLTALMTAFYMWRMMYLTFYGPSRIDEKTHVHESPPVMTVPLVILAAGSVLAGWIGVPPAWTWFGDSFRAFEHWLEPLFGHHELHHVPEWTLMVLSVGVAVLGWWIASRYYHVEWTGPLANAMRRLWFIDEFYNRVFVRGLAQAGGLLAGQFDARIVDGGVNGAGWLTRFTSQLSIWWDTWIVDGLVRAAGVLARAASWPVRWAHTGLVQSYALVFVLGVLVMLGFYVIR